MSRFRQTVVRLAPGAILLLAAALRLWRLDWVRANGKPVDPRLWRAGTTLGAATSLYDLRPDRPLVPAPR